MVCAAETSAKPFGPDEIREIPIFPLSIVAFPGADVPLNIFEARYRVLFNTLLAGAEGIEEDLVNDEKPWHGSRLFGMCFITGDGRMSSVGTTLNITQHQRFPDGKMFVNSKGVERFQVMEVVQSTPVVVCKVKMLEDSDDRSPPITELANSTVQLFKDLVSLNIKMQSLSAEKSQVDSRLDTMGPREVAYYLATIFDQVPVLQQSLLEALNLEVRLSKIKEILEGSTNYLRAQVALKSAFAPEPSATSESDAPSATSREQSYPPEQTSGKSADEDEMLP